MMLVVLCTNRLKIQNQTNEKNCRLVTTCHFIISAFSKRTSHQPSGAPAIFLPLAPAPSVSRHLGLEASRLPSPFTRKRLPSVLPACSRHACEV